MTAARIFLAFVFLTLLAPAGAQAELVFPDTGARDVFALDDTLVYNRVFGRHTPSRVRPWVRVVDGRRLRARGMPRGTSRFASAGAMGRDHEGRVVLTIPKSPRPGVKEWWLYDVRRDRARRIRGLRRDRCAPVAVAIWRGRLAYTAPCSAQQRGVFVRYRGKTRRIAKRNLGRFNFRWTSPLALRGGTLLATSEDGEGIPTLWRLMDSGEICRTRIEASTGTTLLGAWISGRTILSWLTAALNDGARDTGGLVGTRLGGRCEAPGQAGPVPLAERPTRSYHRDVDGDSFYFSKRDGIHRVTRGEAVTAPPANDDFANATGLPATPPLVREVTIGNATTQPGEPDFGGYLTARRSVWYVFRPTASQQLSGWSNRFGVALGVFTGSNVASVQPVGTTVRIPGQVVFDAQAGETYHVAVGCPGIRLPGLLGFTCNLPLDLEIRLGPD